MYWKSERRTRGQLRQTLEALKSEARVDQTKDRFFLQSLVLLNNLLPSEQALLIIKKGKLTDSPSTFHIQQFRNPDYFPISGQLSNQQGAMQFLTAYIEQGQWQIFSDNYQLDRLQQLCTPLNLHSAALIPVVVESESLGALLLLRGSKSNSFTYEDIEKASPFVSSLSETVAEAYLPHQELGSSTRFENIDELNSIGFSSTHIPTLLTTKHLNIVECNQACESLLGVASRQLEGLPLSRVIPENTPGQHLNYNRYHCTGFNQAFHTCYLEKRSLHLQVAFRQVTMKGEQYWWISLHDITELTQIRNQRQSEISRFETISDATPVGVLQVDVHWNYMYSNDMWTIYSGMDRSSLSGTEWLKIIPPDLIENIVVKLYSSLERNAHCVVEFPTFKQNNSEPRWLRMKMNPYGHSAKLSGMVLVLEDTTELHIQHENLLQLATTDSLTGLTNRAYFGERLHQELDRVKRGHHFTVISIDLDGFKDINDSLGHDVGDALLVHIAHRLVHAVRDTDTVARLGGDEFALLLTDCSRLEDLRALSRKVIESLSQPIQVKANELLVSASMGAFICQSDGPTELDIMKYADLALYEAKRNGKNQLCIYTDHLSEQLKSRLTLTAELHTAWQKQQYRVFYQLQWNRVSQRFDGAEALIRWQHPTRGVLPPGEFLTTLEADGLIEQVTQFVLEEAIQTSMHWRASGLLPEQGRIAVNISARLFRHRHLPQLVAGLLKKYHAPGNAITLEVTESAFLEDNNITEAVFAEFEEMGVAIALDDFGTGYSPLTYLSRINMDTLKIDKSFIFNIDDFRNRKIVEIVISLAHSLNIGLVAEGIDNRYTYAKLSALGCTKFQGFLMHKPACKEECEQVLFAHKGYIQSFMATQSVVSDQEEIRSNGN